MLPRQWAVGPPVLATRRTCIPSCEVRWCRTAGRHRGRRLGWLLDPWSSGDARESGGGTVALLERPESLSQEDCITHRDASAGEEAAIHLESILVRDPGRIGRTALRHSRLARHHVLYRAYATRGIHVGDVEWNARPIHPEAGVGRLNRVVDEEHSRGVGELPTLHQARRLLLAADGEFDGEADRVSLRDDANGCRVEVQSRGGRSVI